MGDIAEDFQPEYSPAFPEHIPGFKASHANRKEELKIFSPKDPNVRKPIFNLKSNENEDVLSHLPTEFGGSNAFGKKI